MSIVLVYWWIQLCRHFAVSTQVKLILIIKTAEIFACTWLSNNVRLFSSTWGLTRGSTTARLATGTLLFVYLQHRTFFSCWLRLSRFVYKFVLYYRYTMTGRTTTHMPCDNRSHYRVSVWIHFQFCRRHRSIQSVFRAVLLVSSQLVCRRAYETFGFFFFLYRIEGCRLRVIIPSWFTRRRRQIERLSKENRL